jgi:hypothetical protein
MVTGRSTKRVKKVYSKTTTKSENSMDLGCVPHKIISDVWIDPLEALQCACHTTTYPGMLDCAMMIS